MSGKSVVGLASGLLAANLGVAFGTVVIAMVYDVTAVEIVAGEWGQVHGEIIQGWTTVVRMTGMADLAAILLPFAYLLGGH